MKRVAIITFAILLVYSSVRFYEESLPPSFLPFHRLYDILHGNDPDSFTIGNLSSEQSLNKTGPNVWMFLVLVALLGLFVSWLIDSEDSYLNRMADEWRRIDSGRATAASEIGGIDKAEARKHRYRAAQLSLDRAERMIMDFYDERVRDEPRLFGYTVAFVFILAIGAGFIFLVSVFIFSSPLLPTSKWVDGNIVARVRSLEASRPITSFYLVVFSLLGMIGIAANWLLSIWNVRKIAGRVIRKRIDGFEDIFEERLLSKLEANDRKIRQLQTRLVQMSTTAQRSHDDLEQTVASGRKKSHELIEQEVLEIKGIAESLMTKLMNKEKE